MPAIYSQREEYELITALKGRGELPVKFVYFGTEGVRNWTRIVRQRTDPRHGGINTAEADLLKRKIANICNSFGNYKGLNIIDLGCGEGSPVYPIFDYLTGSIGKAGLRYVPIDISQGMLDAASGNMKKRYGVKSEPHRLDFESGNFSDITFGLRHNRGTNILMLLGSTLGNQPDMYRVLSNFRDSMTSDDYLLVGVELINLNKVSALIANHYQVPEIGEFGFLPFKYYGLRQSDFAFVARFNRELSRAETFYIPKRDISFSIGGEPVMLEKGEEILSIRSVKFADWQLAKLFSDSGYRVEMLSTSQKNNYALILCQPSRFKS